MSSRTSAIAALALLFTSLATGCVTTQQGAFVTEHDDTVCMRYSSEDAAVKGTLIADFRDGKSVSYTKWTIGDCGEKPLDNDVVYEGPRSAIARTYDGKSGVKGKLFPVPQP